MYDTFHYSIQSLLIRHRHPLKWRKGFGYKRIDTERQQPAASLLIHIPSKPPGKIDDRINVLVLLKGKPHHKVELKIWNVCCRAKINGGKEMMFFNAFVDNSAHACASGLRRKSQGLHSALRKRQHQLSCYRIRTKRRNRQRKTLPQDGAAKRINLWIIRNRCTHKAYFLPIRKRCPHLLFNDRK